MNKEELLLEIIEKVHEQSKDQGRKLEEIAKTQVDMRLALEQYNIILDEHMRRTEAAELQIEYVKKHVVFVNNVIKFVGVIGTIVLFFVKILPLISSLLSR